MLSLRAALWCAYHVRLMFFPIMNPVDAIIVFLNPTALKKRIAKQLGVSVPTSVYSYIYLIHPYEFSGWAIHCRGNPEINQIPGRTIPKEKI